MEACSQLLITGGRKSCHKSTSAPTHNARTALSNLFYLFSFNHFNTSNENQRLYRTKKWRLTRKYLRWTVWLVVWIEWTLSKSTLNARFWFFRTFQKTHIFPFFKKINSWKYLSGQFIICSKLMPCWKSKVAFWGNKTQQYKLKLTDCHHQYPLNQQISNSRDFSLEERGKEGFTA